MLAPDLSDVRDVEFRTDLHLYVLLQSDRGDATAYYCNYVVNDVVRDSFGPSASGKIPEAFETSFVVTVQPVANPRGQCT